DAARQRAARLRPDSRRNVDQLPGHTLAIQEQIGLVEVCRDRTAKGKERRRIVDHLRGAGLQSPVAQRGDRRRAKRDRSEGERVCRAIHPMDENGVVVSKCPPQRGPRSGHGGVGYVEKRQGIRRGVDPRSLINQGGCWSTKTKNAAKHGFGVGVPRMKLPPARSGPIRESTPPDVCYAHTILMNSATGSSG